MVLLKDLLYACHQTQLGVLGHLHLALFLYQLCFKILYVLLQLHLLRLLYFQVVHFGVGLEIDGVFFKILFIYVVINSLNVLGR